MKAKYSVIFTITVCLIFSSCANVVVNYGNPSPNSGNIVLKTNLAVNANITLNDSLILSQRYFKTITIKNVPEGRNAIHLSADSKNFKEAMDNKLIVTVEKGKTNTQLLTVPPKSNGYWISNALLTVGMFVLLLAIY